jgi:peptidylprolyl isomerase
MYYVPMNRSSLLIAMAWAALAFLGCGGGGASSSVNSGGEAVTNPASTGVSTTEDKSSKVEKESGITLTEPGIPKPAGPPPRHLVKKDLIPGFGAIAKKGDQVTINYVGSSFKTGKEFGTTWDREEPLTFTLGAGKVIAGWEQGIVGMEENGRRELIVPPDLAYGSAGLPPKIGKNETLVFLVDLVSVQ